MSKEFKQYRQEKEEAKFCETVTSKAIPAINHAFKNPIFSNIDQDKLIKKVSLTDESLEDFKAKERVAHPIQQIFPYHDELVELGVNSNNVKNEFYLISEDTPYFRDLVGKPDQLNITRDFIRTYRNPLVGTALTIVLLDILGLPKIKEIKEPGMIQSTKEALRKYTLETMLSKFIKESGQHPEDSKFDHVKTRINQDLDAKQTRVFLYGGEMFGTLEGQDPQYCAFKSNQELSLTIAQLIEAPTIKNILINLKLSPIDINIIMQNAKKNREAGAELIKEWTQVDLSKNACLDEVDERLDNYKILLDLYINSQIPLLANDYFI